MMRALVALAMLSACGRLNFDLFDDDDTPARLALPDGGSAWQVVTSGNVLYAVFAERIFRSTDRGGHWTECNRTELTGAIAVDPIDPDHVIASDTSGIYRSKDGCASWTTISSMGAWYVAFEGGEVWAIADTTYREAQGAFVPVSPSATAPSSVSVASDGTILVGTWDFGVFRSIDNGMSFQSASAGITNLTVWNVMFLDPARPGLALATTEVSAYVTTDGGGSWALATTDVQEGRAASAPDDRNFVIATSWRGLYVSNDSGATFGIRDARTDNMNVATPYNVVFDPAQLGTVYLATERGVFAATDRNLAWTNVSTGIDAWVINELTVGADDTIYAATTSGILQSTNDGATWSVKTTGMRDTSYVRTTSIDTELWTAGKAVLWRSTDRGESFASTGLALSLLDGEIKIVRAKGSTLLIGTSFGVWRSVDGGTAWTFHQIASTAREVKDIVVASSGVWVATSSGLFQSNDGGQTFVAITLEATYSLFELADGTLLSGTLTGVKLVGDQTSLGLANVRDLVEYDGAWIAATDADVFISRDRGATWQSLGARRPHTVAVDSHGHLFVGTNGFGIWRMQL